MLDEYVLTWVRNFLFPYFVTLSKQNNDNYSYVTFIILTRYWTDLSARDSHVLCWHDEVSSCNSSDLSRDSQKRKKNTRKSFTENICSLDDVLDFYVDCDFGGNAEILLDWSLFGGRKLRQILTSCCKAFLQIYYIKRLLATELFWPPNLPVFVFGARALWLCVLCVTQTLHWTVLLDCATGLW